MVAISKRLLSLLLLAVATALSVKPTCATLTPFPVEYDGLAMLVLANLGEIGDIVAAQSNTALTSQYNLVQKKVQELAAGGTLTSAEYVRLLTKFNAEADKVVPTFSAVQVKALSMARVETEEYIVRAPGYWADFVFGAWISTATGMNNAALTADVKAFVLQIEKDLNDRVSAKLIADKLTAFYTEKPAFATAVDRAAAFLMSKIEADFAKAVAANGPNVPTMPPRATIAPPATNTTTTATPTTTTTTTAVPTTTAPTSPTPTTAAPSVAKANATTTAPAPAAKSSATTFVVAGVSTLVAVGTLVATMAI